MKVNASFNDCKQTDIFQVGNVDDLVELRQYLIAGKNKYLIGFGMEKCNACKAVKMMMWSSMIRLDYSKYSNLGKDCFFIWFDLSDPEEIEKIGVNIREIPTLLAFREEHVIAGWSGLTIGEDNQIPVGICDEVLGHFMTL